MESRTKKAHRHFTASALITNRDGEILLVNHRKLGVWLYPGGHVECDESPDETVVREVKEETGLDVRIVSDRDVSLSSPETGVSVLHQPHIIWSERIGGKEEHYHIDLVYLCSMDDEGGAGVRYDPEESCDIRFFSLKDLEGRELFPNVRILLERVLKK